MAEKDYYEVLACQRPCKDEIKKAYRKLSKISSDISKEADAEDKT